MKLYYKYTCQRDGLLRSVRDAAEIDWLPYRGSLDREAYLQARYTMRLAIKLGLYPTMAQLEAEQQEMA